MAAVVGHVHEKLGRFMHERVSAQPDARSRLRAYIGGLVAFNAAHRDEMEALMTIFLSHPGEASSYGPEEEIRTLSHLELILREGQERGSSARSTRS
ncbi:hypothetical protein ACFSTC_31425 [Nonomuraea ferruginea]